MHRKLAAILAADVVGFTGMIVRDEEGTLRRVEQLRHEVIGMQVEAHRGRVFKAMGDGFLAEFSSTIEAVHCAVAIQRTMAINGARDRDTTPMRLRLGVSVGDVVVQDGDLLGEGVNQAARLQALAEPGGIAVSGEIMSQIRGKIDLPLQDCGHQRVKDSDDPIHVYMTREHGENRARGLFDFDEDALAAMSATGGCLCGAIRYEISLPPISTGYCHCRFCQRFTGAAMSAWTAFPASGVRFPGAEPRYFSSSPIGERGFCPDCGSSLTYRLVQPRRAAYLVVMTTSLDEPGKYAPAAHSGIESRMPWLDILDDLPRTTCANSRVLQEAWSSVGLPDPETWVPHAKPPKVF